MGELEKIHYWKSHRSFFNFKSNKNLGRYFSASLNIYEPVNFFVKSQEDNLLAESSTAKYLLIGAIIPHFKQSDTLKHIIYIFWSILYLCSAPWSVVAFLKKVLYK